MSITSSKNYNEKIGKIFLRRTKRFRSVIVADANEKHYDGWFLNKEKISFQISEALCDKEIKEKIRMGTSGHVGLPKEIFCRWELIKNTIISKSNKNDLLANILLVIICCIDLPEKNYKVTNVLKSFRKNNQKFIDDTKFKEIWLMNIIYPLRLISDPLFISSVKVREIFRLK